LDPLSSLSIAFRISAEIIGIGRQTGNAIALAQPFQQVAVAAALAAEREMGRNRGLAAERTGF